MSNNGNIHPDDLLLQQLRTIILSEDRQELERIKQVLNDPNLLAQKVDPIIHERITFLKNNFPVEFNNSVEQIIESKLEESQEEIISIIAPRLGLMIKKYVQSQIQELRENIQNQIDAALNKGPIGRLKRLFGILPKEMNADTLIANASLPGIEEIFVVEKNSGILLGSASKQERVNLDVVAGMLTAIKAFVEDAFDSGTQQLETIEYETYTLLIQTFPKYYIAAALSGAVTAQDRNKLKEDILLFAEKELRIVLNKRSQASEYIIKQKLEQHFLTPNMSN